MLKTFAHHAPSPEAASRIRAVREAFSQVLTVIEASAPLSRERSIAVTNLETAAMWAIKAIVVNDPESVVAPEDL